MQAHIRVHVGVFAIKLTRKQRLCQRHRAPLDRYIFISISRMFLKPYSRETSHMGHIFHNDVLAYTLENARTTWYRVNWSAPLCFARANRSAMREHSLVSPKRKKEKIKKKIYETHVWRNGKEQKLITGRGIEKIAVACADIRLFALQIFFVSSAIYSVVIYTFSIYIHYTRNIKFQVYIHAYFISQNIILD